MLILSSIEVFLLFSIHLALLLFSYLSIYLDNKNIDRIVFCLVIAFYGFLVLTRTGYGVDEPTYRLAYESYINSSFSHDFEYSFVALFYVFDFLGIGGGNFNNAIAITYLFLVFIIIANYIKSPYKSLALIFFLFSYISLDLIFNGYRQGLSFLILLFAIFSFNNRQFWLFLIFAFVSIGFHWSASLIVTFFLLSRINFQYGLKSIVTILIFVITVVFFVKPNFIATLVDLLSMFKIDDFVLRKLTFYLESDRGSLYELNFFGRLNNLIMPLSLLFLVRVFYRIFPVEMVRFVVFLNVYCIMFIEMAYSFRNFYWYLLLLPFFVCHILTTYRVTGQDTRYISAIFCMVHIFTAVLTYYSVEIFSMVFIV